MRSKTGRPSPRLALPTTQFYPLRTGEADQIYVVKRDLYFEQIVLLVQGLIPILQVGIDPLQLGDDLLLVLTAGASVKAEAAACEDVDKCLIYSWSGL